MSKFTTEVRWIVDVNAGITNCHDIDSLSIPDKIIKAAPNIFNFSYPIWDENDRINLEKMILMHYYMREIGFETVGLWKLALQTKLNEIMPYYIDLWKTTQLDYDILEDVNLTEDWTVNRDGSRGGSTSSVTDGSANTSSSTSENENNTGTTTGSNTVNRVNSDLPQVLLNNVTNVDYASGQSLEEAANTGETTASRETSGGSEDESTTHIAVDDTSQEEHNESEKGGRTRKGTTGSRSYTQLISDYRNALLQIPRMIIDDLSDLFMGLW